MRNISINPGTVRPLPDGRWTFTLVIDGVEQQDIVAAQPSACAAKAKMRAMVEEKRRLMDLSG